MKLSHSQSAYANYRGVAPVRERGLKSRRYAKHIQNLRRSREGAWIEINMIIKEFNYKDVAPVRERGLKYYVGGKIESVKVAPVRERGLKLKNCFFNSPQKAVAPVRERGLKYVICLRFLIDKVSLP